MPNRVVCDVLKEIRTAVKVGRIDMILGLVEEVQTAVNRMEAKLYDYSNLGYDLDRGRQFKKKLNDMQIKAKAIEYSLFGTIDTDSDE